VTSTPPHVGRAGSVLRHTVKKERTAPVARTAPRRNSAGHDLGTVDLEPTVFGLTPNRAVLHQVVTAQLAAVRAGTQSTRTRAEVRGGGAKPLRQKGTGRARQGSSRSPSMSGGGVALGPKPRSYAQHTPKKMVRLALLSALSDRADIGRIAVLDEWGIEEPDTREAATILRKLRLKGSVLVVLANDQINLALSLRNLPEASITTHAELSAHDVIKADWLLFSDRTLPTSPSDFSGTHVVEPAEKLPAAAAKAATAEKGETPEKTVAPAKKAAKAGTDATDAPPAKKPRATKAKAAETETEAGAEAAPEDEAAGAATVGEAPSEEGDADA
jgi:large subunit ribosomal protein L4